MDIEDCKKKIKALEDREKKIPAEIMAREAEIAALKQAYDRAENERILAQQRFNIAKKQRNKAYRDKMKIGRLKREIEYELKSDIPRRKTYYQRKIKQLEKEKAETQPATATVKKSKNGKGVAEISDVI